MATGTLAAGYYLWNFQIVVFSVGSETANDRIQPLSSDMFPSWLPLDRFSSNLAFQFFFKKKKKICPENLRYTAGTLREELCTFITASC